MARDSRRADSRRVVAVGSSSGGGATVRCKLVLVFLVLLLAIIVPAAYAENQGESHHDFLFPRVACISYYVDVINFVRHAWRDAADLLFTHGDMRYKRYLFIMDCCAILLFDSEYYNV